MRPCWGPTNGPIKYNGEGHNIDWVLANDSGLLVTAGLSLCSESPLLRIIFPTAMRLNYTCACLFV